MSKKKISTLAEQLLEDKLKEKGFLLWNIEFVKEVKDWFLRVYIDKEGGISLQDCEEISRFLSEKLDEEDVIEQNYFLEVSSPGLERVLVEKWHYEAYIGKEINLKLYKAESGRKNFQCKLLSVGEACIEVEVEKDILRIDMEKIAKANLVFSF